MEIKSIFAVIATVATIGSGSVFAQQVAPKRASAGHLELAGSQKGAIVLVNKQTKVAAKDISEVAAIIEKQTHCKALVGDATAGQVVVEIIDDTTAPALAAYPEDFKATVNVAKLTIGLQGAGVEKFLTPRTRKEILRAFCYACGAGGSQYPDNIMAIDKISDLDLIQEFIPGDTVYACQKRIKTVGVTQKIFVPYAKACKDGWAPAPTNDAQRAVWNRIQELKEKGPSNPIKIVPPSKK